MKDKLRQIESLDALAVRRWGEEWNEFQRNKHKRKEETAQEILDSITMKGGNQNGRRRNNKGRE